MRHWGDDTPSEVAVAPATVAHTLITLPPRRSLFTALEQLPLGNGIGDKRYRMMTDEDGHRIVVVNTAERRAGPGARLGSVCRTGSLADGLLALLTPPRHEIGSRRGPLREIERKARVHEPRRDDPPAFQH